MSKVVYVDTSRTVINGKWKRRSHVVYDGEKTFKVDRLTKLDADEVFIDTLFPEIYEEVLELLKNGVKVYLLANTRILKKLRMENDLRKNDENDAIVLSKVPMDFFRLLTIQEIEWKTRMRPLITRYERLVRWRTTVKHWMKRCDIPILSTSLNEDVKLLNRLVVKTSREIIERVIDNEVYREACRMLGIKDSSIIAILTIELPLHLGMKKLKKMLGFTPNNGGKYNHRLREHIDHLAINIYINVKRGVNVSNEFIEIVELPEEKALYELGLEILYTLRKAWMIVNINQANNTSSNPTG